MNTIHNAITYDWQAFFAALRLVFQLNSDSEEKLKQYVEQLLRWNQTYHLIGPAAVRELLTRHLLDSSSLIPFLPETGIIADMGSGAGLPGIVLALLSLPSRQFHLFEANQKKARFLQFIASELAMGDRVVVHKRRVEEAMELHGTFDCTTSRALADLDGLAKLSRLLLKVDGICLAMKGRRVYDELSEFAHGKQSSFFNQPFIHTSPFGGEGVIVQLRKVPRETGVKG
ncbi:Ribosomal RNA small subunit methyltransferase G [Candidatus Magnetaquicoccaceae bacterium FCR-1]|uniref:Ribosomal RNA small subunit methyltransferase G n=1 Tax=Candidatus Magnetaquiglobus chichijimensis TaxID=3141448 RepID=A0ABQ0CCG6_9PROT